MYNSRDKLNIQTVDKHVYIVKSKSYDPLQLTTLTLQLLAYALKCAKYVGELYKYLYQHVFIAYSHT